MLETNFELLKSKSKNEIYIYIIGLGGIGSSLSEFISRYLNHSINKVPFRLIFIDGDYYQSKNATRQEFRDMGNKAEVKAREISDKHSELTVEYIPYYLNPGNIRNYLKDNSIILTGLDNHKTRKLVSDFATDFCENVVLISGGNGLTDGNAQVYIRINGMDQTPPITYLHSEIENPTDKSPEDLSCEELENSEPQIYFANLGAALLMSWVFRRIWEYPITDFKVTDIYYDIDKLSVLSEVRNLKKIKKAI